jgi:hypothetical protein
MTLDPGEAKSPWTRAWETFWIARDVFARTHRAWYASISLSIFAALISFGWGYPGRGSVFGLLAATLGAAAYLRLRTRRDR